MIPKDLPGIHHVLRTGNIVWPSVADVDGDYVDMELAGPCDSPWLRIEPGRGVAVLDLRAARELRDNLTAAIAYIESEAPLKL